MSKNQDTVVNFTTEDGDVAVLRVVEETKINGVKYLLVVDEIEDEEEEALILRETSAEGAEEALYDIVDDEKELTAVAAIFEELVGDLELVTQE
ncbi:MAG: DUF1292 domain-containing protein [Lachnospiraceae bacterium]|nr:DUF1292 domain-containing protein [Lachnospiraceae bacterium]